MIGLTTGHVNFMIFSLAQIFFKKRIKVRSNGSRWQWIFQMQMCLGGQNEASILGRRLKFRRN